MAAVVYYPEYFQEVLFYMKNAGAFIGEVTTGAIRSVAKVHEMNRIDEMLIHYWKGGLVEERENAERVILELEKIGGRLRTTSPTGVKDALCVTGNRAFVINGDFTLVDFISFSMLKQLEYRFFTWDGVEQNVDDPQLSDNSIVVIPPGKAGEQILEIVQKYA